MSCIRQESTREIQNERARCENEEGVAGSAQRTMFTAIERRQKSFASVQKRQRECANLNLDGLLFGRCERRE